MSDDGSVFDSDERDCQGVRFAECVNDLGFGLTAVLHLREGRFGQLADRHDVARLFRTDFHQYFSLSGIRAQSEIARFWDGSQWADNQHRTRQGALNGASFDRTPA